MKEKQKGLSISKLFNNDRFVLIFSAFSAVVLWFVMATVNTEERPRVIYDVPITVELSAEAREQGYQVFEQSDQTAKVSVTGNSLTVNQLTKEDLKVEVQMSGNIRAGEQTLNLVASKQSQQADYEVASVDPGSVIAYIDKYKESTFRIADEIKYTVNGDYFVNSPVISLETVTLSGPEKEVSRVAKVSVKYTVRDPLTETLKFTTSLVLEDASGNEISNSDGLIQFSNGQKDVEVTIPVLSRATVPIEVTYTNKPEQLDLTNIMRLDYPKIEVGASKQDLEALTSINLLPIDFSDISPEHNNVVMSVELPENVTNLSNVYTVNVTFHLDDFTTKTINVDQFITRNLSAGQTADVTTKNLTVTLVGPKDVVESISSSDVYGEIDMTGREHFTGSTEMPVRIMVRNPAYRSWAYGSYKANVTVSSTASE